MRVPGEGPRHAKIALVGEAWGISEEAQGRPFVGASGHLLDRMLAEAGILRSECFVTNVVSARPPKNNFRAFPKELVESHVQALFRELKEVKPNVIVPLGGNALYALTKKSPIQTWRGSILDTPLGKVLPTYHPAYVLRDYSVRPIVHFDLVKVNRESHSPVLDLPKPRFVPEPSFLEVITFLESDHKRLAVDIETLGSKMVIRCVGLANSKDSAICIPFLRLRYSAILTEKELRSGMVAEHYWTEEEEEAVLEKLRAVLEDPKIEKILQNYPFDSRCLEKEFGISVDGLWMDTMVAQHCAYSELPKALDFLASIYTQVPYWANYNRASDLETWVYNCWDCVVTFEVASRLKQELTELKTWTFYRDLAQPAMIALARAGNRGILIDTQARQEMLELAEHEQARAESTLATLVGSPVNPNSPKQVMELLYERLNLQPRLNRKTHKPTVNEEALEALRVKYPVHSEVIDLILTYRENSKLAGTFLKSQLNEEGCMETSYNATGTVTGRISSSKTLEGLGGNLQQIPRGKFRRIYVARPGKVLIKADLSQAEARAVAWFARDTELIENFSRPEFDIHRWNAARCFDVMEEAVTKELRQKGKGLVHALNYRGTFVAAAKIARIPQREAKVYVGRYLEARPVLRQWWAELEEEVTRTRALRTPLGRLRVFLGRLDESMFKSATAFLPQSTIGDIVNRAFFLLDKRLPEGCYPLLQVHDEIVVEAPEEKVDECVSLIRECLEISIKFPDLPDLVIPCEVSVGPNWFDQEKVR